MGMFFKDDFMENTKKRVRKLVQDLGITPQEEVDSIISTMERNNFPAIQRDIIHDETSRILKECGMIIIKDDAGFSYIGIDLKSAMKLKYEA